MRNKLWQWVDGQHGTGYQIFTMLWWKNKLLPLDCYIIRYPHGSHIPPHRDVTKTGKHFRINFVLTHPEGGEFQCEETIYSSKWVNIFRPDLNTHSVTEVTGKRTRYVFSIGCLWKFRR